MEAVRRRLRGIEKVFVFLDDVAVVCTPGQVVAVEAVQREVLRRHAHIDVHQGQNAGVDRGGVAPGGIEELVRVAWLERPDAMVWKEDSSLPRELQRIRVMGAPIAHQTT